MIWWNGSTWSVDLEVRHKIYEILKDGNVTLNKTRLIKLKSKEKSKMENACKLKI